jgi:hypothetical protein
MILMEPTDKISLKAFWETVERRLAASSADELRAILRTMAQETSPSGRQAFLDKLGPIEAGAAGIAQEIEAEDLLADIEDLAAEIEEAMEEAPEPEEHYEWGGYDEEEEVEPYEEFVEPLVGLFDRAQAAFDYGNLPLARDAYAALFELLDQQDDYGRGVSPSGLTGVDITEAWARYLRAVYEAEPAGGRPEALFEQMLQVRSWVAGARPKLDDLIQISPAPLPDRDRFLPDWIAFLRGQSGGDADAWLREAVRLAQGTAGLEALAREEGKQRPRAYLDWFTALEQEGKHREVLFASQEALHTLPAGLPIRAAVADHLCTAAEKLNEPAILRDGRWEAFAARPTLPRLLDLWDAAPAGEERTALMRRGVQHLQDRLAHPPSSPDVAGWSVESFREDDLERPAWPSKAVLAHACLLAGDPSTGSELALNAVKGQALETAHALAASGKELGWSSSENPQGLIMPFFLGRLSGRSFSALPPNLAQLWQWGLQASIGPSIGAGDPVLQRLQRAYAQPPAGAPLSREKQEAILSWCLDIARQRVNSIVTGQHRKSYDKAAVLTVACVEALRLRGDVSGASSFLGDIRDRFPRHRSFQAELGAAVERSDRRS